jgi:hypothetical protein
MMADFSTSEQIERIQPLVDEFFERVIHEYEPVFVSDEARIWDVSTETPGQLVTLLRTYYDVSVTRQDLDLPLWELIAKLNSSRGSAAS